MKGTPILRRVTAILIVLTIGCQENENKRLAEMAQRHEQRQVEQNRHAADLHREVAEGTRRLIESDGKAREEIVKLQRDIQAERSEIGHQRDQLEIDRQVLASTRHFDSLTAVAITNVGLLIACLLPLLLAWHLLRQPNSGDDSVLVEALLDDALTQQPTRLFGPDATKQAEVPRRLFDDSKPPNENTPN
jgi:hypothetical protein